MNQNDELARDNSLKKMEASGEMTDYHIACDLEYKEKLFQKLVEEAELFRDVRSAEKLADMLEVIHTIMTDSGWTMDEIDGLRKKRKATEGGFEKHIILEK